jgi:hypothetical protein
VRFSVRRLIVLVLVIGGGLGWIVRCARDQFAAVKAIEAAGGNVSYRWEWKDGRSVPDGAPWWPKWLSDRIGVEYLTAVARVEIPFVFVVSIPRNGDNRDKRYKRYKSKFTD